MPHTIDRKIGKNKVDTGISEADRKVAERNYRAQEYIDRKEQARRDKRKEAIAAGAFGGVCAILYVLIIIVAVWKG